jgi:choline-glycine betaine transporter
MGVIKKITIIAVLVASLVVIYSFVSDAYEEKKKREREVKQIQETIKRAIVGKDAYEEEKRERKEQCEEAREKRDQPGIRNWCDELSFREKFWFPKKHSPTD